MTWHDRPMTFTAAHRYFRRSGHEVLDSLADAVRLERGGALVVYGEAGIGKTALLRQALDGAPGLRTLWVNGVEFETEFAFAALDQLSRPVQDRLDQLSERHRDALETAFGRREGREADRFAVASAFLGLLSNVAGEGPIMCVVDDAQWLDRRAAPALAFAA